MGLKFQNSFPRKPGHFQSICQTTLIKIFQQRDLVFLNRDDYLPANLVRDGVLPAKCQHGAIPHPGKPGFKTAGLIIDTRVYDSAVPAGLVKGQLGFLLQNNKPQTGLLL
jgi:hypothetical protein